MTTKAVKIAVCAVALTLLASIAGQKPAFAAPKVNAIVILVKGSVEVKRAGAKDFTPIKLNDMLNGGDLVKTGPDGQASLATKGGAEVRLNANSSFEIAGSGRVEQLRLSLGQLWTRMLHKKAKIDVRTPSAVCAVRGTEADIEQRDLLTVKVYDGHVNVKNAGGTQALKAGQMSTVSGNNSAPAAPKQMGAGDKGNWQDGLSKDLKDIQGSMDILTNAAGEKRLLLPIKGADGKVKNVEIPLKKK
ncbi:MAG: hypothetical protein A3J79_14055 [Elusimicrobia bacterium RIFOXYB2_FULL_62_6]|nr:MAG: hypothetical protein A3J79_14055 [Elusimicrobia bacterium RIFOXYB2_FULL_62_6]